MNRFRIAMTTKESIYMLQYIIYNKFRMHNRFRITLTIK